MKIKEMYDAPEVDVLILQTGESLLQSSISGVGTESGDIIDGPGWIF